MVASDRDPSVLLPSTIGSLTRGPSVSQLQRNCSGLEKREEDPGA
jgi:hypothetical protein